jgi:hypothetical protein
MLARRHTLGAVDCVSRDRVEFAVAECVVAAGDAVDVGGGSKGESVRREVPDRTLRGEISTRGGPVVRGVLLERDACCR